MQFYAFDILVSDGEDLRKLPLSMGKTSLARLPARRVDGIFLPDFEQARSARTCSATPVCWAGGHGLETSRKHLPRRTIRLLDQGEDLGGGLGACVD